MSYSNYIPGTNIEYKLRAEWVDLVESVKNKTKFNNIYPYVFSDKMVFIIVHKPSKCHYVAYKKMTGKNDNFSSFIFFHNIGDLKRTPEQYEIYATEYWYGESEKSITEEMLRDKVTMLKYNLANQHYGYCLETDFKSYACDTDPPPPRFDREYFKSLNLKTNNYN